MNIFHHLSVGLLLVIWAVAVVAIFAAALVAFIPIGIVVLSIMLAEAMVNFLRGIGAPVPPGVMADRRWDFQ